MQPGLGNLEAGSSETLRVQPDKLRSSGIGQQFLLLVDYS